MNSIDQQFIEFIVKSLVSKPDAVKVDRRIDEKGVLLELTVDPEDLGRVIGKRGATAQSLRTLLRALGTKNDARYNLKIVDNGPSDYSSNRNQTNDTNSSYGPPQDTQSVPTPQSDDNTADEADDPLSEEIKAEEPDMSEEPAETVEHEESKDPEDAQEEQTPDEDDHESVVSKTRKELEDLDDLDV
ncbi:MAG TPA: KH domain-containing protein [Candidatus Saccharimonadales bacterium]|nr:KH domain-containing protein [Candidatus Saccharimonadales bacterium]